MSSIPCPAPGCTTTWPTTTPTEVLLRLIDVHARTAHPAEHAPTPAPGAAKAEKVKRPTISAAGTSEEWAYFLQRWSDYKAATHLTGSDIVYQLLECCDEMLWKDLTRTFGALASSDESTILKNIKTLAVRQEKSWWREYSCNRCAKIATIQCGHFPPASEDKQAYAASQSVVRVQPRWTTVTSWLGMPLSEGLQTRRYD